MAEVLKYFTYILFFGILAEICKANDDDDEDNKAPCGFRDVGRTLMKYDDNLVNDEESFCPCVSESGEVTACDKTWKDNDTKSITWTHHERSDQKVQYKFCKNITPQVNCTTEEVALLMSTSVDKWDIRIHDFICRCPSGDYQLAGWERHDDLWYYSYVCQMPMCPMDQGKAICLKIYLDRSYDTVDQIRKYAFQCKCPNSKKCVSEISEDPKVMAELESDDVGEYITRNCTRNYPLKNKNKTK